MRRLVTHLQLLTLLLLSSRPLKYPPRSLDFNNFSFSFFSFFSSSFFLIVSASNSFFFSSFSWSNLALYAEFAKRTDFLISLVIGIFSGLQFTWSWNFTASFRSRKPTMVCSPSLDLSFVTTLALTERLRSESAFAWAKTRHDLTRQGSTVVDNGHYLQQMSAKTQCSNNGQLAARYLCHHRSGIASTHPRLRTLLLKGNLA